MTTLLRDKPHSYCPGCSHGIIHRVLAEAIQETGKGKVAGVVGVGCSVVVYEYLDVDFIQAPHGRAPSVAAGLKRGLPDALVFTYQGDGDLAAIGLSEVIHAAFRAEPITVVFVNNGVYGMTGGQMAPTTLLGQRTTTTPGGRTESAGHPVRVCELLASAEGVAYLARVSVHSPAEILRAKRALSRAFEVQLRSVGFSLVEILAACPTNWGLDPVSAVGRLEREVVKYYPTRVFVDKGVS